MLMRSLQLAHQVRGSGRGGEVIGSCQCICVQLVWMGLMKPLVSVHKELLLMLMRLLWLARYDMVQCGEGVKWNHFSVCVFVMQLE